MRKRRDYKAYEATHRVERRAKNVAYHQTHRAEILARSRARYAVKRAADLARKAARRKANPEEGRTYRLEYYYTMPPAERQQRTKAYNIKYADKRRAWREQNKERLAKQAAEWTRKNSGVKQAAKARRLAAKIQATPIWADLTAIAAIYTDAARLTRETGIPHEVDHVVPLRSPLVCGLHIACNLQILTKTENRRKHNRFQAAA